MSRRHAGAAARAAVCAAFNRAGFYRLTGLSAEIAAAGRARVRLRFRPSLASLYGGVHGGAIMALADSAISVALASLLGAGESIATVELTVQFLAPAGRRDLVAEGAVHRRGRRLAFGSAVVRAGRVAVARAQGVWVLAHRLDAGSSSRRPARPSRARGKLDG